ncbi:hypothetical protein LEP1GSC036_0336 [Leptospira weilii str. 2006001853]|uniref:Uncharacterized protein n=2 Tax=Leptospira weilii TaxID=28184 RepID=A0A828Z3Z8_9LEPT|nr:hypothetical protein LEP1GSC036_0336 [Leptospira weilii str. 2006001853]EMJ63687.1 hypothetical protein LEP1GSC051_4263 [Leptospira sp. P2653]EMM73358.1 hypothetical protein LEP1GSC038_2687 [Leptospira weilii str. 2006001855]EMN44138.1 hypothetical protein LEP1GSC086_0815 [Leptospira weilii str. LNT 1234]QDK24678.1 hypothetical protein FHG67_03815 [Leptospira weilii]
MYFLPSEFIRIPGQYLRGSDIFEDFFGMFRLQADGPVVMARGFPLGFCLRRRLFLRIAKPKNGVHS